MTTYELAFINMVNSEVMERNLDAKGHYQPDPKEVTKQIMQNQQFIMLMLYELLTSRGFAERAHELLEKNVKYDKENDRWFYDPPSRS